MRQMLSWAVIVIIFTCGLLPNDKLSAQQMKSLQGPKVEIPLGLQTDPQGRCFVEVEISWLCQGSGNDMLIGDLLFGAKFEFQGGSAMVLPAPTRTQAGTLTWLSPIFSNSNQVITWAANAATLASLANQTFPCNHNQAQAIKQNQIVKFKIYFQPSTPSSTVTLKVNGLEYDPDPPTDLDPTGVWQFDFGPPSTLPGVSDVTICRGQATFVQLLTAPPAGALIKWYKYSPNLCTADCPTTAAPAAPWVPLDNSVPQQGLTQIPTNPLDKTTCYAAVITQGCFVYSSKPGRVTVCEPLNGLNISATGGTIKVIKGQNHACESWAGAISLNNPAGFQGCCPKSGSWSWTKDGQVWSTPPTTLSNVSLAGPQGNGCSTVYTASYTATSAVCGDVTASWTIIIDRKAKPSDAKLTGGVWTHVFQDPPQTITPLGPLCFEDAAGIRATVECPDMGIVSWQELKNPDWTNPGLGWTPPGTKPSNLDPGWTPIAGAVTGQPYSSLYFTNKLTNPGPGIKSRWYRAGIINGACDAPVYSEPYEIRVKPKLTAAINPSADRLCPLTSINLAATSSYGNYTTGLTYQWFRNGVSVTAALPAPAGLSYAVTQGGDYYVEIVDGDCHTKARSKVRRICGSPKVIIKAPCAICPVQKFKMSAAVVSSPGDCYSGCTITWYKGSVQMGTGSSVTASGPGIYRAVAKCGTCTVEAKVEVIECPPSGGNTSDCGCGEWNSGLIAFKSGNGKVVAEAKCNSGASIAAGKYSISYPAFVCKPSKNCKVEYAWSITGQMTGNGTGPITFNFSQGGLYILTITPICGGNKCEPCVIKVKVQDPVKACDCEKWMGEVVKVTTADGKPEGSMLCGNKTAPLGLGMGVHNIVFPNYLCKPEGCDLQYNWVVDGPLSGSGGGTSSTVNFNFSQPGGYAITLTPKCGDKPCTPCVVFVKVTGPSTSCDCGGWTVGPVTFTGATNAYTLNNSSTVVALTVGNHTISLPEYNCGPGCTETSYVWTVNGPNGANLGTFTGLTTNVTNYLFTKEGPFSFSVAGKCNGKVCTNLFNFAVMVKKVDHN